MKIDEITSKLEKIETKIGTLRVNKNKAAFASSTFLLVGCATTIEAVKENNPINNISSAIFTICFGLTIIDWYCKQKQIDTLLKEQRKIKIKQKEKDIKI